MQRLTFLGTSAGLPTKQRNVTALAVSLISPYKKQSSKDNAWLLIDCGEGTQHQILHTPLSLQNLTAICITHVHGDHCYGLAGLLSSMAMSGRKTPLTLIAPQAIGKLLDTLTIVTELYFPFEIAFIALESLQKANGEFDKIHLNITDNHHIEILPIALSHRTPSHAYKISQTLHISQLHSEKLLAKNIAPSSIWGKLQQGSDVILETGEILKSTDFVEQKTIQTNIIIGGDNDKPELLADFCQDIALLVHEATNTEAICQKIKNRPDGFDPKHSSAKQVAEFAKNANIPNLILTHFSARYQQFDNPNTSLANMGHLRVEAENFYGKKQGENLWLANDFDEFEVAEQQVIYKKIT